MAATALHVVITGDPKPFQAALAKAGAATGAFATKTKGASARAAAAGTAMTKGLSLPLVAIGVVAGKMSLDFAASMGKISRLVGASDKEIADYKSGVLDMAKKTGHAPKELADALFFITSAGLKGKDALEALEQSAKASAAGLGETKVVADALTSAMNAYGPANLSAARSTDVLVGAVREGKMEAGELAPQLGKVIPIAEAMGVSFDQVGAAIASMTRTGADPAQAATALRGALATFAKPATRTVEALDKMGMSVADVRTQIKDKGLLSTLTSLRSESKKNGVEMADLFPNVRALSGVLSITGRNAKANAGIFKRLAGGAGDAGDAFGKLADKPGFRLKQAFADIQAAMIRFGDAIVPVVVPAIADILGVIGELGKAFGNLPGPVKTMIVAIGGIAVVVGPLLALIGGIGSGVAALGAAFGALGVGSVAALGPIAAVVAAIAAVGYGLVQAYKHSEAFRNIVDTTFAFLKKVVTGAVGAVRGFFTASEGGASQASEAFDAVRAKLAPLGQAIASFAGEVGALFAAIGARARDLWHIVQPVVAALVSALGPVLKQVFLVLLGTVTRVVSAIGTTLRGLAQIVRGVVRIVTGVLTGDFGKAWRGVKDIFSGGVKLVLGALKLMTAPLRAVLANIGGIIKAVFTGAFKLVVGVVKTGMRAAVAAIRVYVGAWKAAGGALVGALVAAVKGFVGLVVGAVKGVVTAGWNAIKGLAGLYASAGRLLIQKFAAGVRNAAGAAVAVAKRVPQAARDAIAGLWNAFYSAGAFLIQKLIDGFKAGINKAAGVIKGGLSKLRGLLPGSEPKDPSSPLRNLDRAGRAIIDNVSDGMGTRTASFRKAAAAVFKGAVFELDAQIADAQDRADKLAAAFTLADQQSEINKAQRGATRGRRKGEKKADYKSSIRDARRELAELTKESRRAQATAKIEFEIAGLERLKAFKDALGDIRSSLGDAIGDAVGNKIDKRLADELAAIESGPLATELKGLRDKQEGARRAAEDAEIQTKLDKANLRKRAADDRVTKAEAELARVQGSGSQRLVDEAQRRLDLARSAQTIAGQGVASVEAEKQSLADDRRATELEAEIDNAKTIAEQRAEQARLGNDAEINEFRQSLQDKIDAEVGQLETRKQNYAQFVKDIGGILAPLGLVFTGSADQEASIDAPEPQEAVVAKPKKKRRKKRRAGGGLVMARYGELTRVGEVGPEDVTLPRGARVVPASVADDRGGPSIGVLNVNQVGRAADDVNALVAAIGFRILTARR